MRPNRPTLALAFALVALAVVVIPAVGQETLPGTGLAGQSLRPYRFVFYAYALAWLLVFGWVVSVARKASALVRHLDD